MANTRNETIKKRYNRVSGIYDMMVKMINEEWRKELLLQTYGDVLEAGVGTGANLAFYPPHLASLTGVDFSVKMLDRSRQKAASLGAPYPVKLIEADIQNLPFPDQSFDSIVSTCVFCSVPNPVQGLKELKRVLKPGGSIFMLEHMRSDNKIAGFAMDVLNPLTVGLWGANINRETMKNIKAAGLEVSSEKRLMGSIMRRLVLSGDKHI